MKENNRIALFFKDIILTTLFSVLISVLLSLALALVVKFASLSDSALKIINQAVKIISLLFGMVLGIKQPASGAAKGALTGLLYALITSLMLSLLDKSAIGNVFDWLDVLFSIAIGGISGILAVNIKSR
ncbi:MAG: TIGR04086 family membrane protein [Christensenellales bacterium]|jgi:putative membrane protein (TIGR04086 family)